MNRMTSVLAQMILAMDLVRITLLYYWPNAYTASYPNSGFLKTNHESQDSEYRGELNRVISPKSNEPILANFYSKI